MKFFIMVSLLSLIWLSECSMMRKLEWETLTDFFYFLTPLFKLNPAKTGGLFEDHWPKINFYYPFISILDRMVQNDLWNMVSEGTKVLSEG